MLLHTKKNSISTILLCEINHLFCISKFYCILTNFIILFAISFSFVACSGGKDVYDSVNISEQELDLLKSEENDKTVKVFDLKNIYTELSEEKQLSEALQKDSFYLVLQDSEYAYIQHVSENGPVISDPGTRAEYLYNFFTLALYPEKVFDSSVKVKEVYCFASSYYSGSGPYGNDYYIYYKTNKGDFVVFNEYSDRKCENVYVLPINDFRALSKQLLDYVQANPTLMGGVTLKTVADLKPYEVATEEKTEFQWWIPLSIAGGAVIGACAGSLITVAVFKKKESQQVSL